MKKRFNGSLPQKQLKTKLKFEEPVFCQLKASMQGKKEDAVTKEERDDLTMTECQHEVWPTFWPQCIDCISKHKYERFLSDKKRDYRVIEPEVDKKLVELYQKTRE